MTDFTTKKMDVADDVWFEIFLHLPLDSVFKSKCVSKVWFSILSNPNFLKKWYQINYLSLPWGLVSYVRDLPENELRRNFTIAYPDSHSQFINHHQNGFSFSFLNQNFPNSNDGESKELYLKSSSNGLVLCSMKLSYRVTLLYVCNPLTQKSILLPQRPTKNNGVTGLMCNECFPSSLICASYKVIHVLKFEGAAKEFKVEMFCSDLGEWNTYHVPYPPEVSWLYSLWDNRFTHNGVFYWFQKKNNKILAFSVNGNTNCGTWDIECRLINLPDQANNNGRCLGESEGLICYAIVKDTDRSLSVWVLGEDWYLLHKDNKFDDILAQMKSRLIGGARRVDLISRIRVLGFNPLDKNVVILGYNRYVWTYNTRTRAYEQLCRPSFQDRPCVYRMCFTTFLLRPRPTVLPPVCWSDTLILDGCS